MVSMIMRKYFYAWVLFCLSCGSEAQPSRFVGPTLAGGGSDIIGPTGAGGSTSGGSTSSGGSGIVVPDAAVGGERDASVIITSLPPGFVQTEVGGYKLGASIANGLDGGLPGGGTGNDNCGNILVGVVRDFKGRSQPGGHPDFEGPLYGNDITPGLVGTSIDVDLKPIYASQCEEGHPSPAPTCPFGPETTTKANFDQWYRYTPTVNQPYLVNIWFAPQGNGLFRFQSLFFFPVDNAGFGNSGTADDGKSHNFSFTTELHDALRLQRRRHHPTATTTWVFLNGARRRRRRTSSKGVTHRHSRHVGPRPRHSEGRHVQPRLFSRGATRRNRPSASTPISRS
jgi:hypothetical protein